MKSVAIAITTVLLFAWFEGRLHAQSLEPMRGEVVSFSDRFAISVYPGNPYAQKIAVSIRAYDENFLPVQAAITPQDLVIAGQEKRRVKVIIPFNNQSMRKVRVCAESLAGAVQGNQIRTRVCGRFIARKLGS